VTTPGGRRTVATGAPWESRFGYRRALRVGDEAWVSGTTAASAGDEPAPDASRQARQAFAVALGALADLGMRPEHVVRTRMYVTDRADTEAVGAVHGDLFGAHPPTATMVVVAGLIDPRLLVEVELDARLHPAHD
jgi:enamine deaminase RidA (YjgF/YER057c/UK114 family)